MNSVLSIQGFEKLCMYQRAEVLFNKGTMVAALDFFSNSLQLWLLEDFYVELFYSKGSDAIVMAEVLDNSRAHSYVKNKMLKIPNLT